MAAANFAREPVVDLLLTKGADARAVSKDGAVSALDAAIWGGNVRVVKRLMAAGADGVGARREMPPLVRAAYTGRLEVVRALLEARPPAPIVRRALEAARRVGHPPVEAVLAEAAGP
jgi:hypothetical protein